MRYSLVEVLPFFLHATFIQQRIPIDKNSIYVFLFGNKNLNKFMYKLFIGLLLYVIYAVRSERFAKVQTV